jgi:hypothetical protein
MGEHESQAGRTASHGRQRAGSRGFVGKNEPRPDPGGVEGGAAVPPPSGRSSISAKPDFRATVGRRLSEERELGPNVLGLLSAGSSFTAQMTTPRSDPLAADGPITALEQRDEFNTELAHAMQAALSSAHERLAQDLDGRRTAHVEAHLERIARAEGQARARMEQEVARINRAIELETQRIRQEGDVRITAHREELRASLAQGRNEVERAIREIDAAVAEHRAAIDAVMVGITPESDPATIAGLVERLPPVPSLDGIGEGPEAAEGSAAETGERDPVGVMDPRAGAATRPSP